MTGSVVNMRAAVNFISYYQIMTCCDAILTATLANFVVFMLCS